MSYDKKLSHFFDSLKMKKQAILGQFSEAKNSEEIAQFAPIAKELVELEKYQPIIHQLRSSTGVVNLITRNEYQPLVEMIVQKAFPLESNQIFNNLIPATTIRSDFDNPTSKESQFQSVMVQGTDQANYFIPRSFFGKNVVAGESKDVLPARDALEDLLFGTDTIVTRKWLMDNMGFEEEQLERYIGSPSSIREWTKKIEEAITAGKTLRPPPSILKGTRIYEYESRLREILDRYHTMLSPLETKINTFYMGGLKKEEPGGIEGLGAPRRQGIQGLPRKEKPRHSKEDIEKFQKQRLQFLSDKKHEIDALRRSFRDISVESFTGGRIRDHQAKNRDGFISFNPQHDVFVALKEFQKAITPLEGLNGARKAIYNLVNKLEQFHSENPKLLEYRDQLLNFLYIPEDLMTMNLEPDERFAGNPVLIEKSKRLEKEFVRIVNGLPSIYAKLNTAFVKGIKSQGKVMILDDFDRSVFCVKGMHANDPSVRVDSHVSDLFQKFIIANSNNVSSDMSAGTKVSSEERGSRTLLVITSEPIKDLPITVSIELMLLPVDKNEAEIIVNNVLKANAFRILRQERRKRMGKINEKYSELEDIDLDDPKLPASTRAKAEQLVGSRNKELGELKAEVDGRFSTDYFVSNDVRKKLINMIMGLGQQNAFLSVFNAVRSSTLELKDDPLDPTIVIDERKLRENLREQVNTRAATDVHGLTVIEKPEVSFENYAFKKTSQWAEKVKTIKISIYELIDHKTAIKNVEKRIAQIDIDLKTKNINAAGKQILMQERTDKLDELKGLQEGKRNIGKNLPHYYILYGAPGVGKSIFAHALASILGLEIRIVNLRDQRSKWLGETNERTARLINTMKGTKETVFLMDEIDRELAQGTGAQGNANVHETTTQIVSSFLELFENTENDNLFRDNDIFFILTTNNINNIDTALRSRLAEAEHEVELPNTPEDYEKVFKSYVEVEKARFPDAPWFFDSSVDRTPEDGWRRTEAVLNSIDWYEACKYFAEKGIDFRRLKIILRSAFSFHKTWMSVMKNLASGNLVEVAGAPITNENLKRIGQSLKSGKDIQEDDDRLGVATVSMRISAKVNDLLKPYVGEETFEAIDPDVKVVPGEKPERMLEYKKIIGGGIPPNIMDEINKIASGKDEDLTAEEYADQYEYQEVVDPVTGRIQVIPKKKETIEKEVKDLTEKSFQTEPVIEGKEPEKVAPKPVTPSVKKQEKPLSPKNEVKMPEEEKTSSDYLFNYLRKNGIISESGEIIRTKKAQVKPVSKPQESGVYNFGNVIIAPGYASAPVQYIQTEEKKKGTI